jgi:hypothetical protein
LYDTLTWNGSQREFRFGIELKGPGVYVLTRCLPSGSGGPSFIACAQVLTPDAAPLERVLDGLRLEPQ